MTSHANLICTLQERLLNDMQMKRKNMLPVLTTFPIPACLIFRSDESSSKQARNAGPNRVCFGANKYMHSDFTACLVREV